MRAFKRTGLAIAVTAWAAVGCGSINAVSSDGGTGAAGTTGGAGATGGTGTTGVAGSSGTAGASGGAGAGASGAAGTTGVAGSDGGGGAGGVGPSCPGHVPNDQAFCARDGLVCEYGDDPRGDSCRTNATCSAQRWKVGKPDSNSCPSINYGPCTQKAGGACTSDGSYCVQGDGSACVCASCAPTAPVCTTLGASRLYCNTNSTPACPAAEPNLGTACAAPEGMICAYCPDASRVCSKGIWIPGDPCARAL